LFDLQEPNPGVKRDLRVHGMYLEYSIMVM